MSITSGLTMMYIGYLISVHMKWTLHDLSKKRPKNIQGNGQSIKQCLVNALTTGFIVRRFAFPS